MRMIDADIFASVLGFADADVCEEFPGGYCEFGFSREKIRELLRDIPTVDAVPVVRCRDCKHHRDKNEQEQQYLAEDILICTSQDATEDCWNAVWPDHFCSYGEKEGAG